MCCLIQDNGTEVDFSKEATQLVDAPRPITFSPTKEATQLVDAPQPIRVSTSEPPTGVGHWASDVRTTQETCDGSNTMHDKTPRHISGEMTEAANQSVSYPVMAAFHTDV